MSLKQSIFFNAAALCLIFLIYATVNLMASSNYLVIAFMLLLWEVIWTLYYYSRVISFKKLISKCV